MKTISNRVITLIITLSMLLAMGTMPAQAASISDGNSKTVTVGMGARNYFLSTTYGNNLGGSYWQYTTNDGIIGAAYCIDHGLAAPSASKPLTISGLMTGSPQTMGAFANGYPQRSLSDFLAINLAENPELAKFFAQ